MQHSGHAEHGRGVAVVLVRNAVDHDSRVLREARTLQSLGLRTTVLGVVSFTQDREVSGHRGVTVRRLGPRSRLGWRVYREISNLRPGPGASGAGTAEAAPDAGRDARAARPAATGHARGLARRALRWLSTLAYYARAIPTVAALRPDIVHCNDYNTMWIGVAARLACGSAVIYDAHELWADRNLRSEPRTWLVACEALFTRVAERVLTTSPAYAEELARRYRMPEPVVVRNIPERRVEGAPPERVAPTAAAERAQAHGGDGRVAVYVGGLQPGRGLESAIRAVGLTDGLRLRLLGPGAPEYRDRLARLVRSLGLEDRVDLLDPVPPEELIAAVSDADVGLALIQPTSLSYRLTLPNKLFEYALAGLPVLGSDLPMIGRFLADHRIGQTVDPDDPAAIARALDAITEPERNAAYRLAAAAAAERLDWAYEREVLSAVYREVLESRRAERAPAEPDLHSAR